MRLRYEVEGEVQFSRDFGLMEREARDMSEPLREIGEDLVDAVERQFETEGSSSGRRWSPLNPTYAAWKRIHFGDNPILVRTGRMKAAATLKQAPTLRVSPVSVVYEPPSEVAAYHQRGSGNLPQRRLVDLTALDRRDWDRILATWITSIRRYGPIR